MLLTHEPSCLLYFDDESDAALRLAEAAGLAPSAIERHRLPDGELKLRLPPTLPGRVVLLLLLLLLLRTLAQPNEKLVELLLAAQTARALGARHLALVAP
jgi:ribose-phosphate pyrophosphokinase